MAEEPTPLTAAQVFGRRLREQRRRKGISQEEVALKMAQMGFGMGQSTISEIEKATRSVSLNEAFGLALVVGERLLLLLAPEHDEVLEVVPRIGHNRRGTYEWIGAWDDRVTEVRPEDDVLMLRVERIEAVIQRLEQGVAAAHRMGEQLTKEEQEQ